MIFEILVLDLQLAFQLDPRPNLRFSGCRAALSHACERENNDKYK
jgi:hypothetical protein